jgi:hypothetical protein
LEEQRQRASTLFTGVIDELRDHLLGTSRPPQSHLTNGADDWQNFCFNTLAVEDARRREEQLWLTLSASDPAAARRGLAKYQRRWSESLQAWFGCAVSVEVIPQTPPPWQR